MDLDPALGTFIVESREILEEMEELLLRLETEGDEQKKDSLNAIFRVAHTIKGSAGLFKFQEIVSFTHVVESLLDKLREGVIAVDDDVTALLLKCGDHIGELVTLVEQKQPESSPELTGVRNELLGQLASFGGELLKERKNTPATQTRRTFDRDEIWHISLRFGTDVFRDGMDPLSFIRYLATFGTVDHIVALDDGLPDIEGFNPESCYLGFEISFKTNADKQTIENAFKFVRESSIVRIFPPNSIAADFIQLIKEMPEEERRLGEILVECGSLTPAELDEALAIQQTSKADSTGLPLGEVLIDNKMSDKAVVDAALSKQANVRECAAKARSIRVDADKLDEHIDLVGELVIASAGASLRARQMGDSSLDELTSTLIRLVEEVRDSALHLRMVEIGPTFNKFQRVVHDMSKDLQKDIEIVISGADTDLDKTVIEKMAQLGLVWVKFSRSGVS